MVAPNREIANKYIFSSQSAVSTSMKDNTTLEDVNMDEPRGRSTSSSPNASREPLAHSDLSSVLYVDRMEAQSEDPVWANQTEQELFQLSYAPVKRGGKQ